LKEHEVSVLTNEAIEAHLAYLRSGLGSVHAALPVLRDKIDLLSTKVEALKEKMHADGTNEQRAAEDAAFSAKMEALRSFPNTTLLVVFAITSVIGALIAIARILGAHS
jgi:hypothetical protein